MNIKDEFEKSRLLEAKALEECDNHPIETPGLIQSYGALLAFNFDSLAVTYVSENISDFIDVDIKTIFHSSVTDLFKSEDFHEIANIASHQSALHHREQVKIIRLNEQEIDLSLYRVDRMVVLELVPILQPLATIQINSHLKWTLDNIKRLKGVDEIIQHTVEALRKITGFDKVMAMKFHSDDSGEIFAESSNGRMDSYLGLRFPKHDIPPIARNLLRKMSIRHVSNTADEGQKIIAADTTLPPLNLSLGILRGSAIIHGQYLKNMGVKAAMTLPIIIKDKLWGLFTLHSLEEQAINSEIAYSAEIVNQLVALVLEQRIVLKC